MNSNKFSQRKRKVQRPSTENEEGWVPAQEPESGEVKYLYDAPGDRTEIMWKCLQCGELKPRNGWTLSACPSCGAPKSQFVLVDED